MKKYKLLLIIALITASVFSQNKKTMKKILSDYSFKTHCLNINNTEVRYVKEGKGNVILLFIHGLSSNLEAWEKNIKTLKNKYTCVALDLPGYGKSFKPNADYTPTFFANTIHKFIDELKLKNIVLIGHSMGGQASIKLAANYPKDIEKLVLVAPAGLEQFKENEANIMKSIYTADVVKNTTEEQIKKNYAINFFDQSLDLSKMINDRIQIKKASDFDAHCNAIVKSISGMLNDKVYQDLENINHKTLIIFGKNDMLIPNRYFHPTLTVQKVGEIAKNKIKNSTLNFIENSGHFVQYEKAKEVNLLIQKFVENN